ncbi:MAG: HipA domain-containing protein [Deltaproteobacteria bacterium]|nr:HipA domain-containing protein [Deltaproteobacteria bacterium]
MINNDLYIYIFLPHCGWVSVGLLRHTESGRFSHSTFRYGKKYLQNSHAISIDPVHLPLLDKTFGTKEGFEIFNGIRDAAPDKWGRYLLDKKFGRGLSELQYVAASGTDRVGALAFGNDPVSGPCVLSPSGFQTTLESLDIDETALAVEDALQNKNTKRLQKYLCYGPSLGGARPKATVLYNQQPHLAKFSTSLDQRNEPLIEYATMTLAKQCRLDVPDVHYIESAGRSVYLIRRFDRDKNHHPIPFISGLTATGLHESDYAQWSYFRLCEAIVRFSVHPVKDLHELYKRMLFNILVYNNDDHMKNFGFVCKKRGYWNLSPLYDVLPAIVHTETFMLAMSLGVEGKRASIQNALSQCESFRLQKTQARWIVNEMKDIVSCWEKHFVTCGVSRHDCNTVRNSFADK